jgi:2,3-bisphosphoglycerate-dependent phosphoglycerate mutase
MQELQQEWVPVVKDWRLNERNYGALVGRNKKQCVEEYGSEQVRKWRRSWDTPPPPMDTNSRFWPARDPRYQTLGIKEEDIPRSESLKEVTTRTTDFWDNVIVPQLKERKRILIVGHENNLRSIIKRLDGISNEDIIDVELPRAIPLIVTLDANTLKPIRSQDSASKHLSGRYLGDKKAIDAIAERDLKQVYDLSVKDNLEATHALGGGGNVHLPQ